MSQNRRKRGERAETAAKKFLENKGYRFIERNFYARGGEIDLIMQKSEWIVFVEVKSVRSSTNFSIFETVSKTKLKRIFSASNHWLLEKNSVNKPWRVDFVGVIMHNKEYAQFEHIKFLNLD